MKKARIALTADIHYGNLTCMETLANYINDLNNQGTGYLIVAGDLCTFGADDRIFDESLEVLRLFQGKILVVPGNHDLWTFEDSFELYEERLPEKLQRYGMKMLDGNPFIIGNTGFVGSIGWYDYSFRLSPEEGEELFNKYIYKFADQSSGLIEDDKTTRIVRWVDITEKDYATKVCTVSEDGLHWERGIWNDKYYINWKYSDKEFLDLTLERLKKDIEKIYDKVDQIVAVLHHLPFVEFVPYTTNPVWAFHRAFQGSYKIGELLLKYPKIKQIYFGHTHRGKYQKINNIDCFNLNFLEEPQTRFVEVDCGKDQYKEINNHSISHIL